MGLPALGRDQRFIAGKEFLDLHDVVRERFGRRVDGREAAADHDDGQAYLQVGDRVGLRCAGELQRHEEIRSRPHAAGKAVRDFKQRRAAGTRSECDVIEPQAAGLTWRKCVFRADRSAEPHAAEHRELRPALEQQADDLEIVFVPADGDAVFGYAAKAGENAVVE